VTPEATQTPPAVPSVRWLGHASAVAELGGRRVLFDPLGRRRARAAGPVDAVVITHAHVDHLNRWSLKAVDRAAHLVVPRGARRYVADLGFARVTEMEPGDHLDLGGLDLIAVPTRHDGGRWRRSSHTVCNGYVATAGGFALHHAGDVDVADHDVFDAIGRDFRLDASLLPIGGMLPVWYYRWRRTASDRGVHIDPDAALAIFERLGARTLVPVHWGTLNLRLGPSAMPRRRLVQVAHGRGVDHLVRILDHGERLALDAALEPAPGRQLAPADATS
jgi:L-ascorbate metabolism protein UlaG (beta-lactamase superfamily)